MPVAPPAPADHRALGCVQRHKQRRRSTSPVIVHQTLDIAEPHRLRMFEHLHLVLFIQAQNDCVFRRIQIQPHDVAHLLDEKRIVRELEMPLAVRVQPERLSDAVHGRFRQSRLARDLPNAPVRTFFRLRLQRPANQLSHALVADRTSTAGAQLVVQPVHIPVQESPPLAHRGASPNWWVICWLVFLEALVRMIRTRLTSPAGRECELAMLSSCSRCSQLSTNAAFGRPIAIGTPRVRPRCLFRAMLMRLICGTEHQQAHQDMGPLQLRNLAIV